MISGNRRVRATAIAVALVAMMTACGGTQSVPDAATNLIEGDFADQYGLDLSDATCTPPDSEAVGTTFACVADADGSQVAFEVEIDREDHIVARSLNVLYPDAQRAIGDAIAEAFAAEGVSGLTGESLDCGDGPIVLSGDLTLLCGWQVDADVFDLSLRINDVRNLVFDFVVADEPRS